ncbi:YggN family protein [Hanstruepera flava]|uniref:YggN family protein n=1 Tax=Hanstruepera flava TaxID=2930218 RepID=UPI0020298CC6|nr:YggN family protein [Hanstruepera flava]
MKTVNILSILFFLTISVSAQQRLEKISQSVNVNDDVIINLNTSQTDIIIDTWNKDIIEVEAYMESNTLTKQELETYLKGWKVSVDGSKDNVTISSNASGLSWTESVGLLELESIDALQDLEIELADLPVMPMVDGLLESMDLANMPKMPKMPDLPDLPEGMNNINFDFDKYEKEGEAYMDKWSKEYGERYGEAYAKKMEKWAKSVDSDALAKYEKEMEAWGEKFGEEFGEKFGKEMEAWGEAFGESFGKSMEAWGEKFGEDMEKWGEEFGKEMEERAKVYEERAKIIEEQAEANEGLFKEREDAYRVLLEKESKKNLNIKKTIKIKIPKDAKLKVNVRHGELKFSNVIHNLKADLNHATFLANSIDGEKTSINASYTSVFVKNWNMGELKLNFVQDALLQDVNGMVLNSNSSNIGIDRLSGNAIINGSFGDLVIHNINDNFNNLNITLDNSNAAVKLPKGNFKLQYQGKHSYLEHPENNKGKSVSSFNLGSIANNKTIVINAKYSKVIMQ